MKNPICLSPLKFYDSVDKQCHHKSYAYNHVAPLVTKLHVVPAFQFILPSELAEISSVYIKNIKDNYVTEDVSDEFINNGLSIKNVDSYRVVFFYYEGTMLHSLAEGKYYIVINFSNSASYYSEVFCFTNNVKDYLQLKYRNDSGNLCIKNGVVTFCDDFTFNIFLKYEKEVLFQFEEQSTDKLGYKNVESQISKKLYAFFTILPEFICDALRIVRLCDNKEIWLEDEKYELIDFEMDVKWQTQGDLAVVNCIFESDQVITNVSVENLAEHNLDFNLDFTV